MPTFDMVVVGSGGGPSETNVSGYLFKTCSSSWEDGVIGLEAGSGLGALHHILKEKPELLGADAKGRPYNASTIYSYVRTYLITHAHLDHIMSLVLLAGSSRGCRKRLMGTEQTLMDLEENIFKPSRVWPNLASRKDDDSDALYLYNRLEIDRYQDIGGDMSVQAMCISHGGDPTVYESSAFFIRHDPTSREFLFFGDVEPDSLAPEPLNRKVWQAAAAKIPHKLDTLFIECSWPSGREDSQLYGHLTPDHLVRELEALAQEVINYREKTRSSSPVHKRARISGVLRGLRVYITHCKEDLDGQFDRPIHEVIVDQIRELVKERGLGVEIFHATQGTRIYI